MTVKDVKVIYISPTEGGVTKEGKEWTKITLVVEDDSREYGESTAITYMNDNVRALDGIKAGDRVNVSFSLHARSYTDRLNATHWNTEARGFGKVEKL